MITTLPILISSVIFIAIYYLFRNDIYVMLIFNFYISLLTFGIFCGLITYKIKVIPVDIIVTCSQELGECRIKELSYNTTTTYTDAFTVNTLINKNNGGCSTSDEAKLKLEYNAYGGIIDKKLIL